MGRSRQCGSSARDMRRRRCRRNQLGRRVGGVGCILWEGVYLYFGRCFGYCSALEQKKKSEVTFRFLTEIEKIGRRKIASSLGEKIPYKPNCRWRKNMRHLVFCFWQNTKLPSANRRKMNCRVQKQRVHRFGEIFISLVVT